MVRAELRGANQPLPTAFPFLGWQSCASSSAAAAAREVGFSFGPFEITDFNVVLDLILTVFPARDELSLRCGYVI